MENTELDPDKENSNQKRPEFLIVKKGLIYYLFKLVSLPFLLLGFIFKYFWKYIKIYFGWYKDHLIHRKKANNLNKYLNMKRQDDEVI